MASAQAPSSAQRWEFAFIPDSTGPFAAGESTTAVGITLVARVGIMPNASASGTANFGVSRIGGGNGTFFMNFSDPAGGPFASGVTHGPTGEGNDTNGNPLAGHFAAFRGSFAPQVGPDFVGSNLDDANGIFSNIGDDPRVTSVVGSRQLNFNGTPLGVAQLDGAGNIIGGDFALVYRVLFLPKAAASRNITLSWQNISGRYVFGIQGTNTQTASSGALANGSITFRVPTPGAAALLSLGGLAAMRRRRA
ncbi:MAG: hypothetical protein AB7Q91_07260 [Phycisphaerales bacterium]